MDSNVLYLCDMKACEKCSYPTCAHTKDIEHAVNFKKEFDYYVEVIDKKTVEERPDDLHIEQPQEKSQIESWAEKEVRLACEREIELSGGDETEYQYGCLCYQSALDAIKSLYKDGHSGCSIGITKGILNRLIDIKPLTPIEDVPEVWNNISDISGLHGEEVNYQCNRMSALFKYVYADGSVKFSDVDRCYCVDINNPKNTYTSGLVRGVIDELFPIKMPYIPFAKPIKVYCEEFLTDRKNGDYDTVGVMYCIMPTGEKVKINRFFKETKDDFKRIGYSTYLNRKHMDRDRQSKEVKMDDACPEYVKEGINDGEERNSQA